jgi:predicted metal-dependent peptidase
MSRETERKLAKSRVAMLYDQPFFGHLALNYNMIENNNLNPPTMATDGANIFYHEQFVKDTSLEHLKFVLAHEVMHCVLWHLPRLEGREPFVWNCATDFVVNSLVSKSFPDMPPGLLIDSKYENKTADWVYNQLPVQQIGGKGGKGKGGGQTLDSHEKWKDWGNQNDDADGKGSKEKDPAGAEQLWRERIASASQAARQQGKLPGGMEDIIKEILQPQLDWKTLLWDMLTSACKNDYKWNPPNKKQMARGFILPSVSGEEISIAAAYDTSGSMSDHQIAICLAEIRGICDSFSSYCLYLFAADAAVNKEWELHEFDEFPMIASGRGGTDFRPVFNKLEGKEFSVLVYFTDLCGSFPDVAPDFPVIWVSIDPDGKAPFGQVIYLPKEV